MERGVHCSALSSAYSALEPTEAFAPPSSLFTNTRCVLLPLSFPATCLPGTSSHQALSEHPSAQTKSMLELKGDTGQGKYLWSLWFWSIRWSLRCFCNLVVYQRQCLAPGSLMVMGLGRVSKGVKEAVSVHRDGQELPWARTPVSTQISWLYPFITSTPLRLGFDSELKGAPVFGMNVDGLVAFCTYWRAVRWARALSVFSLMAWRFVAHWWEKQGQWIELTAETEPWKGCGSLNMWFTYENLCHRCCRCYMLVHVGFRGDWTLKFREGKPTEGYRDINNGLWNSGFSVLEGIFEVFWIFQIHILYLVS